MGKEADMKIAVVTNDDATVSEHFGRARYYAVLTIEGNKVVSRETLTRQGAILPPDEQHEARHGVTGEVDCHGTGAAAAAAHERMVLPIKDCKVVLARGMSWSARQCMIDAGIRPILTDIANLDDAIQAYLSGNIEDHVELLH
jgi:predicted Fe-Mo cluster-binding NifX family protein